MMATLILQFAAVSVFFSVSQLDLGSLLYPYSSYLSLVGETVAAYFLVAIPTVQVLLKYRYYPRP